MTESSWKISGEYMESCNCDYLCPCIYTNPQGAATNDDCQAMMVFRIDQGRVDDVDLGGLCFAMVIKTGKVMADGNWTYACVVDERANPAQREALAAIVSGERGGVPGMIRQNLVTDFRGVEYSPIDFEMAGETRSTEIPGILSFAVEGVTSRNRSGKPYYLDNTGHPANTRLALAKAKSLIIKGFGFDLEMVDQGNNGHYAPFDWSDR